MTRATEQALGADSPRAGFFVKLRSRAAQAQALGALLLLGKNCSAKFEGLLMSQSEQAEKVF